MRNLFLLVLVLLASCSPKKETQTNLESLPEEIDMQKSKNNQVTLEKLWESDTLLTTSESVLFDSTNNVLYVSCINGTPPDEKDEDGFIAKVSPEDGAIIERKWVTGLSAPKGLGLHDGTLFVTDIDKVVLIDVKSGKIKKSIPVKDAAFLNDVAMDNDGTAYFSDSNTSKIHMLKDGKVTVWQEGENLGGPNGLFHDGEKLIFSTFGSGQMGTANFDNDSINMVVDSVPNGDGVIKVGLDYLVSNWNGEVYYISADFEKELILDTKEMGANAADIAFLEESETLLVPTFFGNQLVAYKLTKP